MPAAAVVSTPGSMRLGGCTQWPVSLHAVGEGSSAVTSSFFAAAVEAVIGAAAAADKGKASFWGAFKPNDMMLRQQVRDEELGEMSWLHWTTTTMSFF